jgi:hypothetical protein
MLYENDRKTRRILRKKAGNNFMHPHYHPNTNNPNKKTIKPKSSIQLMAKCNGCNKVIERSIDSFEHFSKILEKNNWKKIIFIKNENNPDSSAKNIDGICCLECQKKIEVWKSKQ